MCEHTDTCAHVKTWARPATLLARHTTPSASVHVARITLQATAVNQLIRSSLALQQHFYSFHGNPNRMTHKYKVIPSISIDEGN